MRAFTVFILAVCVASAACAQAPADEQWRAIQVEAAAASIGETDVGQLRFLGGIALRSQAAAFGGLSDIAVQADGAFLAITDAGFFVRGALTLDEAGAPIGVSHVEIGAMRDEAGAPFESKETADSEGMAMLPDGRVAVSFEQSHLIRFYDLNAGPFGPAMAGPLLAGRERLGANAGLEALATTADGRLLVGAEEGAPLWIVDPAAEGATAPVTTLDVPLGYGLVELDRLPDGDFIALQRFYAPVIGNRIRVLRLSAEALLSRNAQATELARFARPMEIDNFEGVSVVVRGERTLIYIVSDDNFNASQRTLLYAFELREGD